MSVTQFISDSTRNGEESNNKNFPLNKYFVD